jgi:hypothetical protein
MLGSTGYGQGWSDSAAAFPSCRAWISALVIVASALMTSGHPARAQSDGSGAEFQFDISSQPLESALEAYAATSRLQVLYETAVTAGRNSSEVTGAYTQEAALRQLLSGTGLDFDYTGERAFTVVPARPRSVPSAARVADYNLFLGSVQESVLAALCRRPETRPGAFRASMQFWIAGSGRLENPSLLTSTGTASRDAAIKEALARVAFGLAPPASMPQPITMVLNAAAPGGADECAGLRR